MGLARWLRKWVDHDRDIRNSISEVHKNVCDIQNYVKLIYYAQVSTFLRDKTLHSNARGVSDERICDYELIVSLTSFGNRIFDVYLTIESIMQGSILPNRIVLWLSKEEFNADVLPQTLLNQQKRGLQIEYCEDIRSYKKLIPALRKYHSSLLLTIDDDVIYDYDMIERFISKHKEFPTAICASRFRKICLNDKGEVESYLKWNSDEETESSPLLFPIGVGGILYPPNSLSPEVLDENTFKKLCPYADDVWFYSMAIKNSSKIIRVKTRSQDGFFYNLPTSNIEALSTLNNNPNNCRNDLQIKEVFEKFKIKECLSHMLFDYYRD